MSPFRVSIVVACYEQGAFLHECLASIAAQTHPAHEVIVVDDGSRDPHTVRALDELCRAPIRLVRQPNLGVSAARNRGIALATGDWILPLDVDDKLAPDALAEYEAAVARDPAVDIWYPDVQIFGVDKLEWDAPEYTPWRLLWLNMLVSSSLVRRAVFDAGLTFNEEIRLGYEDWEFWIRACCEHGFRARALEKRVFFYRKWGHSRLQASDAQAEASRQQLRWSCRIFGDGARLDALKREHSPFFAIAARTPALAGALEAQEFKDCRVVDDCDRVLASGELSLFAERPGRVLLVSLADEPLAGALRDDRWLLEKLALEFEAERPSLLWLVTADEPGAAYSGQLAAVRRRAPGDRPRAVGLAIPLDGFLGRPEIIESRDGLVADVARYAEWLAPDRVRSMIVCGPHDAAVPRPLAEAEREPEPPPAPAPPPIAPAPAPSQVKLRVEAFGQGVSRLARGIIGPDWHDKLWQQRQLVRVRGWFEPPPPPAPPPPPPPAIVALRFRKGPVPFDVSARRRSELYQVSIDAPRFPPSADGPALLVVVPWIIYGGADRAIIDMLQGLTRLRPGLRKYVVSTVPCEQKWAEEVLPYVDGCFHVPPIAREQRHQFLARLVGRLGVTSLLIMNSVDGFDALALIRREHPHVRVVTQQHCFDPDPTSGAESGHPAYAASRVNNLIDAYANVSRQLCDDLRARYYVSPSKLHPIYLGIRTELFLDARRPRFVPGRRPIVLWLGRLADQKDPFTALAVARLWRDRHGTERLHFQL
ncbi:MAG TPA: glycosyltransferase, partial [Polyangia bacterium]|nr:glycosyltransferase [Polyangia bacterium]